MGRKQYRRPKIATTEGTGVHSRRRWWTAIVALLAVSLLVPSQSWAQGEARTDNPGVVGGEDAMDQAEAAQGQEVDDDDVREAEQHGDVIRPEDLSPHERYDLPPNFDPGFQPRQTPRHTRVTIDFRDANLEEVVKFFAAAMSINFIVADSLKADKTITIISPQEVTLEEAYQAFLSALAMNGLTIVPHGNFLKILDSQDAIAEPMVPYEIYDDIPVEARMVTGIIPVENSNIDEIEDVISNFTSSDATIIKFHNSLIINENAANLNRIRALVERLDQGEAASNLYVYRVRHADATEIRDQLEAIFGEADDSQARQRELSAREQRARQRRQQQESRSPEGGDEMSDLEVDITKMIADERTNQLVIVANDRSFQRIKEMIEILDVPTAVGGEVHVKFLEYANAEDLSATLSELASGAQQQQEEDRGAASLLRGEIQITAHTPTNALVVIASPRDFVALEDVIDELDRPRRQVYVEAVIMEIGMDINRRVQLGAASGIAKDLGFIIPDSALESEFLDSTQGGGLGQVNYGGLEDIMGPGLGLGLVGPPIQIPGMEISLPAVALLLQATQTDNLINVLSTPSILTLDNEEAEIIVGERVPIRRAVGGGGLGGLLGLGAMGGLGGDQQTDRRRGGQAGMEGLGALGGLGGLGGLGALGGMVSPIDYEDVGIELRILPQINESDYVRLEVDQEVSDLKGAGDGDALLPTRTRRNAQTTVLVRDQSTIVIGGLMRDVENETVQKVPFLGDIPVVGALFRSKNTMTTKQNLVLMLTPYIIESEADLRHIYDRKMEEREELLRLFARREMEYIRTVDFRKKSGLLEVMRSEITEAKRDEEARRRALEEFEQHGPRYEILGVGDREEREDGQRSRGETLDDMVEESDEPFGPGQEQEDQETEEVESEEEETDDADGEE